MKPPTRAAPAVLAFALTAILAALPLQPAQSDSTLSLDQLMATLRTVRHIDARYIQHRTLHTLRTPLETRGGLHFNAPDHLEKVSDPSADGTAERVTINGNQLTIDRGHATSPIVLTLNDHPEIGVLVDSIRATLSGDAAALRRTFDITLSGALDHWQLVLQPHDPAPRGVLQWMRITGYAARITAIDTQNADGDHDEMAIVELAP